MSETKITLAHSPDQQQALFGYIIADEAIFDMVTSHMSVIGNFEWLNPYLSRLWTAVSKHHENYGNLPTVGEILNSPEVRDQDSTMQQRLHRELDDSVKATIVFGLTPLLAGIRNWQRAVLIEKQVMEMARQYNAGDIPAAVEIIDKLSTRLESIAGATDTLIASVDRLDTEQAERILSDRRLRYGVTYLDESLGGIAPRDLVVISARPGYGKTQLITRIATANAGKRIALFALEAEKTEIERRAKYHVAYGLAFKDEELLGVDYDRWVSGRAPQLDKYDEESTMLAKKLLVSLRTYYRVSGDFGINELEKKMIAAAKTSDLIILDHLHYVDIDGSKNEHTELGRVVKQLRDIALGYGVPIVVVAHLRKRGNSDRAKLAPDIDDIHGASEISKVATSVITFGPIDVAAYRSILPWTSKVWPTIIRVGKHRREGSRTRYSGICFFDPATGTYKTDYAIGCLRSNDTDWKQADPLPAWATSASIAIDEVE